MTQQHHETAVQSEQHCRRRADRIPIPIEISLIRGERHVSAVIRDISFDSTDAVYPTGVGILHSESLPLHESIVCLTSPQCRSMPRQAEVELLWTRPLGSTGFLSGGQLYPQPTSHQ